ncbi:unnamed protein product [Didymodactylos carnosus]|uniref:Uncharacterized protein n=1 Tax=Didymodactylos carnosus TaxID=1234261 RepID=A0A813PX57_9BILA|nr:unnamed protein product [Didymodactylos carnosus]CAF0759793.1 unnamed protein product [Didymodactylos carnosus]CAF3497835.1 unnamed protein product [Didymodactylos carnosus]CAF3540521.1 unnamed protein product [Didymodactylos carnosus]
MPHGCFKYLSPSSTSLNVYIKPGAKNNSIRQLNNDTDELEIQISADAKQGEANEELISYLKSILNVRSNQISLVHGHKQRKKIIRIDDITTTEENDKNRTSVNELYERIQSEIK